MRAPSPPILRGPAPPPSGRSHAIDLQVTLRAHIPGEAPRPASRPLVGERSLAALDDEPPTGPYPGAQIVGREHDRPRPPELAEATQGCEEHRGTDGLSLQRREPEPL